jgi:integrase
MDSTKILTRSEVATVLQELHRKRRSVNTRQNSVIVRLAVCAGLRVSEIVGITLANVKLEGARPHIYIPKTIGKGRKSRRVPLWWDGGTLHALTEWKRERVNQCAASDSPFVCNQARGKQGQPLTVRNAQYRFKTAIRILGDDRTKGPGSISIHCGRHTFCSLALAGGKSLAEVRDAAGHANVSTTSIYLHAVTDDSEGVGNLFAFA